MTWKDIKTVSLVSGGLDSIVMLHLLKQQEYIQTALIVDYDQKHRKEIDHAISEARELRIPYQVVTISGAGLFKSALTVSSMGIPSGAYTAESMATTIVPNRNAVFCNLAASLAISLGYDGIAIAVHAGDHELYPDCRPEFIDALRKLLEAATGKPLLVITPFIQWSKADIVTKGSELRVPMGSTWSCYEGRERHCGVCGTCVERKRAFIQAHVFDFTLYER